MNIETATFYADDQSDGTTFLLVAFKQDAIAHEVCNFKNASLGLLIRLFIDKNDEPIGIRFRLKTPKKLHPDRPSDAVQLARRISRTLGDFYSLAKVLILLERAESEKTVNMSFASFEDADLGVEVSDDIGEAAERIIDQSPYEAFEHHRDVACA